MVLTKVAPLSAAFQALAILGFLTSTVYIVQYSLTWGIAFSLIFMAMFIASMISMERASPDAQLSLTPQATARKRRK